ncbi:MAG: hypothetical protein O2800_01900 [Planctomycetota bacterium]|nr:hypothetical protein [Planctomycetota bacterium]
MSIFIFEQASCVGAAALGESFRRLGLEHRTIRVWRGEALPADLDDASGLILCDHAPAALSTGHEFDAQRQLIGSAQVRGIPIIGLGFGARLLAGALGGKMVATDTIQSGWDEVRLNHIGREDPVLTGQPWSQHWWRWSRERIETLPAGAKPLAVVGHDPSAFLIGTKTYGFIHHWEWTASEFNRALAAFSADLGNTSADAAQSGMVTHGPSCARLGKRMAELISILLW